MTPYRVIVGFYTDINGLNHGYLRNSALAEVNHIRENPHPGKGSLGGGTRRIISC
jgi:hypothetical protein